MAEIIVVLPEPVGPDHQNQSSQKLRDFMNDFVIFNGDA